MEVSIYYSGNFISRIVFDEEKANVKKGETLFSLVLNDIEDITQVKHIYLVCIEFNYTDLGFRTLSDPLYISCCDDTIWKTLYEISDNPSPLFKYTMFKIDVTLVDNKLVCDEKYIKNFNGLRFYCKLVVIGDSVYKQLYDRYNNRIKWPFQSDSDFHIESLEYYISLRAYRKEIIKYCNTVRNKYTQKGDNNVIKKLK